MAVLSNADRKEIWAQYMRTVSQAGEAYGALSKADLRAAVNATDQWIEDNAGSYNSTIPLPARTALSVAQKTRLFNFVATKRFGVL